MIAGVIDCGEAGAALRVVVKESALNQWPAQAAFVDTVGHCYTLRPAPPLETEASGWRAVSSQSNQENLRSHSFSEIDCL